MWGEAGRRGLYLGSVRATFARRVSWYMLMIFRIADTTFSSINEVSVIMIATKLTSF